MLFVLVILCFCLSGFAALLYQIVWLREFSIAFGTSEIAVAIVLAGYMAGLALGAIIAARYIDRVRRPVLVYGVLEGLIALAALSLPFMLGLSSSLYEFWMGNQASPPDASGAGQALFYSTAGFLVLLIPTALMGATLPLLARYAVTSNAHLGSRISLLYTFNTLGAVAGAVTAGFLLLPTVGLQATIWVGVAANLAVFVLAILLSRSVNESIEKPATSITKSEVSEFAGVRFILPLIGISGAISFLYEVLWTRMLSHSLGSSIYAFTTMLAVFLTGIALGSAMAGPIAKNPRRACIGFSICQFGIAIASALVYWRLQDSSLSGVNGVLAAFTVILPSTLFIGATYPLAVRAYAGKVAEAGRASAVVYGWNTIGAILGALAAGFLIIPHFQFSGSIRFAVIANLLLGVIALLFLAREKQWPEMKKPVLVTAVVLACVIGVLFQPQRPDKLVTKSVFGGSGYASEKELFYAVGRSSTVYLGENSARFDLITNGLPEAQIEFKGAAPQVLSQRWLGLWASLARPSASNMLVVGLGGGVVLEGVSPSVTEIDVIEIEKEVITANRLVGSRRTLDPLSDPRFNFIVNDARNALRLTSNKYDAIVSQPSHPWTAGASHLFTREFFALVKTRLNKDGVFVQWMNAEFLTEDLFKRLVATLRSEFAYMEIYQPSSLALHFIVSESPIEIEKQISLSGEPLKSHPEHYYYNGITGSKDLVAALLLDDAGSKKLAQGAALISDDDNRMALDSVRDANGIDVSQLTAIIGGYDPLLLQDSSLRQSLSENDLLYVSWRLLRDGYYQRVQDFHDSLSESALKTIVNAMLLRYNGNETSALKELNAISSDEGLYEQALFLAHVYELPKVGDGTLPISDISGLQQDQALFAFMSAWKARGDGDYDKLRVFEASLAEVQATDLWVSYADLLRAEWRLHFLDSDASHASDALQLVDQSLAASSSFDGYIDRAKIGQHLKDDSVLLESIAFAISTIRYRIDNLEYYGYSMPKDEYDNYSLKLGELDSLFASVAQPGQQRKATLRADRDSLMDELKWAERY